MINLSYYKPNNNKIIFRCSKIYDFQTDEGFGGIGDRFVGLVSSFILALLLNYEFRIHWIYPMDLNTIFIEKNIKWNKKDYDLTNINEIRLMDNDVFDDKKKDLLYNKINNLTETISIVSNKFFAYYLMRNNNFKDRIKKLNINETRIYQDVIHLLFNFNKNIQDKYEKILYNFCNYYTIGIQVRSYIHEYKIKINDYDYLEYTEFIDKIIKEKKDKNIMLFICCDSKESTNYFSEKYGSYKQLIISGEQVHLEKTNIDNKNLNNNIKLFLEIFGLGKCNELMITNSSNFGRLAALRTMKFPKIGYRLVSPHPHKYNPNTFTMPEINKNKIMKATWYDLITKDKFYN